ncbi:MAG: hypothetical protein K2Q18_07680 [Bdellovibrionales bacterium]|nr:hypothetical protein [Bdellovibrionales bacterium]
MTDQPNKSGGTPPNNNSNNNNPARRNNNRRRHHNRPRGENTQNPQGQAAGPNQPAQSGQPRPQNAQGQQNNQNRPRRPQHNNNNNNNNQNRPRQPQHQNQPQPGGTLERTYEKYLNLLDQHLIARRKYHDMFYRSEPSQKNKLERNFYNTLNDIREFENKLSPEMRTSFEKRNNGYQYDRTYTSNHEIPVEGDSVPSDIPPAEPHYLQSQIAADYSGDVEESVGTAEDYLKYKNLL